jgi:hypothetical protein
MAMPGMPYHLEKGGWLSVLDDYLNGRPGRSAEVLERLRDGATPVPETGFLDSPALDVDPDYSTVEERQAHLRTDWFGQHRADGAWEAQAPFLDQLQALADRDVLEDHQFRPIPGDEDGDVAIKAFAESLAEASPSLRNWPSTGFWVQYHGDVEGIVRETLVRAIEVSLGLDHDEPVPAGGPTRELPIELYWKCPQRWFEGWVGWRWDGAHGTGQVTVLLATPGSGKPILEQPLIGAGAFEPTTTRVAPTGAVPRWAAPADPATNPDQSAKGLWVISHREHVQLPSIPGHGGTATGDWPIPEFGATYVGVGPVICVQPSEPDGGVKPYGRPYVDAAAAADGGR